MVACHYFRVAAFSRKFLKVAGHKLQRSTVEKNSSSNSVCLDSGRTFLKKKKMRYLFFISTGADIDQVDQVCR